MLINMEKYNQGGRPGGLLASSLRFKPCSPELPVWPPWPLLSEELQIYLLSRPVPLTKRQNTTQHKNASGLWLHLSHGEPVPGRRGAARLLWLADGRPGPAPRTSQLLIPECQHPQGRKTVRHRISWELSEGGPFWAGGFNSEHFRKHSGVTRLEK